MRYSHVCLESWGYVLPEEILTSKTIEEELAPVCKKLKLPTGFLEIFTGIGERRVWKEKTLASEKSIESAKKALSKEKLKPQDLDCLIHVSVSRDCLEPSTASIVHAGLGLPTHALNFDLSNACLGFINGLFVLGNMIELGHIKRGILVGTEISYPMIRKTIDTLLKNPDLSMAEGTQYLPSLTLGSGSAAIILAHDSVAHNKHKLLGGLGQAATQFNNLCRAVPDTGLLHPADDLTMTTEAQKLMHEGIQLAKRSWPDFQKLIGWKKEEIQHFFGHQVGRMPREEVIKALGLTDDKDYSTFPFLGNMGSVSLPITFQMGIEKRNIQSGDKIALMGFGSGINCLFAGVTW